MPGGAFCRGLVLSYDLKYSDCVIFLIFSSWVHFADLFSTWDKQVVVSCFDSDYLLFFLACILLSMESQRHCVVNTGWIWAVAATVDSKTIPFLPESNAARKPSQWNWQTVSTMLELKSQEQPGIEVIEKSYSRAWHTNPKILRKRQLSVSNWTPP